MVFPKLCLAWELGHEEGWVLKNWCFWTMILEKTLESPLGCKEIKPINPQGNQPWIFIGRTDDEAEAPILWPLDMKSWLIRKDPDAGKDWKQEEKGMTEDEVVGWHHRLNGHKFEQALGAGEGQGSLVCCSPRGHKDLDMTEQLNNNDFVSGSGYSSKQNWYESLTSRSLCSSGADNKQVNYAICLRYLCSKGIREEEKELWGSVPPWMKWSGRTLLKRKHWSKELKKGKHYATHVLGHKCQCKECAILANRMFCFSQCGVVWHVSGLGECWNVDKRQLFEFLRMYNKQTNLYLWEWVPFWKRNKANTWPESWLEYNVCKKPGTGHKHM